MKIKCPTCAQEIQADDINISKGIALCKPCNEVLNLSLFQEGNNHIPLVEKPSTTKIESYIGKDLVSFILPSVGFRGITIFFFIFSLFWNAITYTLIIQSFAEKNSSKNLFEYLFFTPFVIVGIIMFLIFIYLWKAVVCVWIDHQDVKISRKLFGKSFDKNHSFSDLELVESVVCYEQNRQPIYGIGLQFSNGKWFKFGSNLKEEEKKWLLYEIHHFWKNTQH